MKELDKEKLAREYTIRTTSWEYYNSDMNAKRIEDSYLNGYNTAENHYKPLLEEAIELLNQFKYLEDNDSFQWREDWKKVKEFLNKIENE